MRESVDNKEQNAATFGDRLRREREMRGVSLDEIADATKIGTRLLRALEDQQFELLPGGIFNKGFVRAYAKYLGINEDQAVADYLQAAGDDDPDVRVVAEQNSRGDFSFLSESDTPHRSGFPVMPVLILLVVVAGGFGGWKIYQERMAERERRTSADTTPASNNAVATSASSPASPAATPEAAASNAAQQPGGAAVTPETSAAATAAKPTGQPATAAGSPALNAQPPADIAPGQFEVVMRATDRAWVSVKADGKFVVRGVIEPNQVKTIRASSEVVLVTGNAGVTEVAFNGKNVPVDGGSNDVRTLVFTPNGLLARPIAPQHQAERPAPSPSPPE